MNSDAINVNVQPPSHPASEFSIITAATLNLGGFPLWFAADPAHTLFEEHTSLVLEVPAEHPKNSLGKGEGKGALTAGIPTSVQSTTLQSYRQPTTHMYPHNACLHLSNELNRILNINALARLTDIITVASRISSTLFPCRSVCSSSASFTGIPLFTASALPSLNNLRPHPFTPTN